MARKASMGDAAPLAKQIKQEASESVRVILDSNKVELATKELAKIPKKTAKKMAEISCAEDKELDDQVSRESCVKIVNR